MVYFRLLLLPSYLICQFQYFHTEMLMIFAAVIYPSLKQLDGYLSEPKDADDNNNKIYCEAVVDADDECGICMETSDKMVLPNCGHSMCIGCFRDW